MAARFVKDDGFTDDLDPNGENEIDDQDMIAVRGILKYDGVSGLTATLIGDYTDFTSGNRSARPLDNLSFAVVNGAAPQDFGDTRNNLDTFHDWETGGVTLTLEIPVGENMTLTSVTGYREYESDFFFNTDGTEIEVTRSYFAYESDQFSEELRLSSNTDGPLSWLVGGYFLTEDKEGALGLGRNTHPAFGQVSFIIPNEDKTDAWALFGEMSYQFNEQWTGTVGVRYSDEEKEDFTSVGAIFGDFTDLPATVTLSNSLRVKTRPTLMTFSPRFVRPNDETMIYGSFTEGFKSGGWNAFDGSPHSTRKKCSLTS